MRSISLALILAGTGCATELDSQTAQDITTVDGNWVSGFAADSIKVGYDNDTSKLFYPCHANFVGGVFSGKYRTDWTGCDFGYNNLEYTIPPFQTLTPQWASASGGTIPTGATSYGNESTGEYLYICRASYGGLMFTGKIRSAYGGCLFGYQGVEMKATSYDVLVNTSSWAPHTLPVIMTYPPSSSSLPLPWNAIAGAVRYDGSLVYPCIGSYAGGQHPGWMHDGDTTCTISYWGREYTVTGGYFSTLAPEWNTPGAFVTPFIAGYDANGNAMGVCEATWPNGGYSHQVGEYWTVDGTCRFGYGGREVILSSGFQILSGYQHPIQ